MVRKLMIKESNNKTIYDDIVKKVLTPYLEPHAKSAIKLFDSPFGVYNENKGLVTIGESMLGNIAYNYAKENGYSSAVLNLIGNYYDVDSALVISVKDGRQRTYPKFKNIARTTSTSITKELIGLSIKLNDVIRDIANELVREFKGVTNESMKRGNYKMVRKINESANYNIDANKLAKQVNNAIKDAVTYVDSNDASPTWHWYLTSDGDYDYELVLGFSAGFEPNENKFTDSNGDALCLKWARIKRNSAMGEYDIDYEFPYDEETGEAWDSEVSVNDYDMTNDVKWLVKDFLEYADNNLGIDEACGKKMKKEAFDPDKLERTAKTNKRDFAEIISNELADMDWRDYVDGNYDTEDEAWEAFVDMTYQTLLKEPETIVDYLEDIDTAKSDELIKLINKYYIKGTKESFRRPSKNKVKTESFYDIDNLDKDNLKGWAVQIHDMNSGYIHLLCYNNYNDAIDGKTTAEYIWSPDEDRTDEDNYADIEVLYDSADKVIEEIDHRHDLDYYKENGKQVWVYGDDDGYYKVVNAVAIPLYL